MDPAFDGYRLDCRLDAPGSPTADRRSAASERLRWISPFDPPPATVPRPRAQLWRGTRLSDELPVAIKVVPLADSGTLRREAALLSAVGHPNVLALLEVVTGPEHVGLVTGWAPGGTLRSLLARRGRLTWQESLTVLIPLADALAAADERGMVHGDLSCANVLFDAAGRPLLADLGAARAAEELSAPVAATPTDVAPEVARGAVPDHRSDLFSLGSVALQCLTGRPAWPAHTIADVLARSTAGEWPDPDDVIAPEELVAIVRRLLDPEPARRGSAASASVDLRAVGDPVAVELEPRDADGSPRLPATEVRPDVAALRRAELADVRHRYRRRSRHRPRGRHSADRRASPDRSDGAGSGRDRASPARADRRGVGPHRTSPRTVALAVVIIGMLGFAAVRAGLWWAGQGRAEPASVSALPPAPSLPALAASAAGVVPAGGAPAGRWPAGVPSAGTAPAGTTAAPVPAAVDWAAEVARLDVARAQALVDRDPRLLDLVYTPGSAARSEDERTIERLVTSGYRLTDARHTIDVVTVLSPQAPPDAERSATAAVWVVEALPAVQIVDDAGRSVGHTAGAPASHVVLSLVRTRDGYRIDAVGPG